MRRFKVYHSIMPTFDVTDAASFPAGYAHVAWVNADDLDEVYALTQNIEQAWVRNTHVKRAETRPPNSGERSTSVGDVIYDVSNGLHYAVASLGFELFTPRTPRETSKERATS